MTAIFRSLWPDLSLHRFRQARARSRRFPLRRRYGDRTVVMPTRGGVNALPQGRSHMISWSDVRETTA